LRARNYGLRGLEASHPALKQSLKKDAAAALADTSVEDVPMLYWTGLAWAAAISQSKDDPYLVSELPIAEALVRRALALDEAYDHGAIHTFLIGFEMARAGLSADAPVRAREHFARALELTQGKHAGPYVTYAESVAIAERNRVEFEEKLRSALKIDAARYSAWRLANEVMQRRARWLLSRADRFFAE
jgi:predicted anti-sigma-YlaC factor YlaD